MFVHEIMNDSISSSADVKRLFTSTAMSHFWYICLKKVRFEGIYSAHDGHFRSVNNGVHSSLSKLISSTALGPQSRAWSQIRDHVVTSLMGTRRATLPSLSTLSMSLR